MPAIELGRALGPRGHPVCLGMPSVDKLMPGSTLHPISQPITRKQRFGRGHCASWLLRILHGFYLGVLEVPSTRKQLSSMSPANAPATLCFIPPPPALPTEWDSQRQLASSCEAAHCHSGGLWFPVGSECFLGICIYFCCAQSTAGTGPSRVEKLRLHGRGLPCGRGILRSKRDTHAWCVFKNM